MDLLTLELVLGGAGMGGGRDGGAGMGGRGDVGAGMGRGRDGGDGGDGGVVVGVVLGVFKPK